MREVPDNSRQIKTLDGLAAAIEAKITCVRQPGVLKIIQEQPSAIYDVIPWAADPNVPVLYFQFYEGELPLHHRKVTDLLSSESQQWATQTMHPIYKLPVMHFHPCQTQEWFNATGGDWLLWLQYFGRCAGLDF